MVLKFKRITPGGRGSVGEGQAIDAQVGALNTFQVHVGGNLAISATGTIVRVTDVLPRLFTIEDALLGPVDVAGALHVDEDGLLLWVESISGADQTTSQDAAAVGFIVPLARAGSGEIIGNGVDNDRAANNAAVAVFVQGHQRGDQADVSARRRTTERLQEFNVDGINNLSKRLATKRTNC